MGRTRGKGTCWKDPRGTGWIGQLYVTNEFGQTTRCTVRGKTEEEVRAKLAARREKSTQLETAPESETVTEYMQRWIARLEGSRSKIETYRWVLNSHVLPRIGQMQIGSVTPADVENLYAKIRSKNTRAYAHMVLSLAFDRALKLRQIDSNPCVMVQRPRTRKVRQIPMTVSQVSQLLESTKGTPYYALLVTAALTGMREGELFGLQRDDVDLAAGRIYVRHALKELKGNLYLEEPKSEAGLRSIDLPQMVIDALRSHFEALDARRVVRRESRNFVFVTGRGRLIRCSNFTRSTWPKILKAAGLPRFVFHTLRHTMATMLLAAGTHPKVVQERIGHSSVSITLDTYSHLVPSMQREAAEKLDRMFAPSVTE